MGAVVVDEGGLDLGPFFYDGSRAAERRAEYRLWRVSRNLCHLRTQRLVVAASW